jgi:hypothetical protein
MNKLIIEFEKNNVQKYQSAKLMAFYKLFSKSHIISNALNKVIADEKEERN